MFVKKIEANLSLVLLTQVHAQELYNLVDNNREYLERWMTWPPKTTSVKDAQSFIKASLVGLSENKELACGIEYNNAIVGVITFNRVDHELKKAVVGYWVAEDFQGKGLVTKSCIAFIEHAFDVLDMIKVEIHVATENFSSQKVCHRLGFQLEGVIKNSEYLNGKIIDHNVYGLMKADVNLK